jgi:hypothetical protein
VVRVHGRAYGEMLVQYPKDLQADSGQTTDAFSVAELYADSDRDAHQRRCHVRRFDIRHHALPGPGQCQRLQLYTLTSATAPDRHE